MLNEKQSKLRLMQISLIYFTKQLHFTTEQAHGGCMEHSACVIKL